MINSHIANSHSPTTGNPLQKTKSVSDEQLSPFTKRILIVDDDPDITFTFKKGFEAENEKNNKAFFKVYTHDNPLSALSVLRELYPTRSIGCFIKKPVSIEYLVKRVNAELD